MLKELRIRNLALIEEAVVSFGPGLTVITGETGAGKSVFLTALRLLGGGKFSKMSLRHGCDEAKVEGSFIEKENQQLLELLQEEGIECDDGEVVIERSLNAAGKSRGRINGTLVNQALLQRVGEMLLQSHGQSEQLLLRDLQTHGELLDHYGGHLPLLHDYRKSLAAHNSSLEALTALKKKQQELATQEEFLRFQFEELERAKLKIGEEEQLSAQLKQTATRGEQVRLFEQASSLLRRGEGSLAGELQQLSRIVERLAQLIPSLKNYAAPLEEAKIQIQELEGEIERLGGEDEELSEAEIDRLNSRLALLQKLQRKYHTDIAGLIELRDRRSKELQGLQNAESDLAEADENEKRSRKALHGAALTLHKARRTAADGLHQKIEEELQRLGMAGAKFSTRFVPMEGELQYGTNGADQPEFYAAINQGEGIRPLKNSLSGGELSRLMLALKTTLAERDTTPVLLFDEVEAGISGETGHAVGERLSALGKHHQVITVSHLHQVAARADHHLLVSKSTSEGRTRTSITSLDREMRSQELARMLGAPQDNQTVMHARSLLDQYNPSRR